jgi:hypothetical protein
LRYGWIEDPEPFEWPAELRYTRGEVVRVTGVELLEGRRALVIGYDAYGEGGSYRYVLNVEGDRTSWALSEENLQRTGVVDASRLPARIRPVVGDGTVVTILDSSETRELGLSGALALTEGLWWSDGSDTPQGYNVRLPGKRRVYSLPFGQFELIEGRCSP